MFGFQKIMLIFAAKLKKGRLSGIPKKGRDIFKTY